MSLVSTKFWIGRGAFFSSSVPPSSASVCRHLRCLPLSPSLHSKIISALLPLRLLPQSFCFPYNHFTIHKSNNNLTSIQSTHNSQAPPLLNLNVPKLTLESLGLPPIYLQVHTINHKKPQLPMVTIYLFALCSPVQLHRCCSKSRLVIINIQTRLRLDPPGRCCWSPPPHHYEAPCFHYTIFNYNL